MNAKKNNASCDFCEAKNGQIILFNYEHLHLQYFSFFLMEKCETKANVFTLSSRKLVICQATNWMNAKEFRQLLGK